MADHWSTGHSRGESLYKKAVLSLCTARGLRRRALYDNILPRRRFAMFEPSWYRGTILFADVTELHTAILEKDPRDFVSHYLFEPVPFAFNHDLSAWIHWKTILAQGIEVDPHDIVLTGSAAVGFSLNPSKNFREFHEKSDIDCGVISPHHFELAWRYLRQRRASWLSINSQTKSAIRSHKENYVFAGTIATDKILALLPFGKTWQAALDKVENMGPIGGREVKLRIYKDYDALRYYQAHGIEKLRDDLADSPERDAGIPTEE